MTETPQDAQAGVASAVQDLSGNTRALVQHEIAAAQRETLAKAKQAAPALGLLAAAGLCGVLSAAASFQLSLRLLEKVLPPPAAALTAAAGYGLAAGAAGTIGVRQLRRLPPLFPEQTARQAAKTVADTARAASR